MDIWFTLFVISVSLLVAVGGALLLVSHLSILAAALSFGWRVWLPTLCLPLLGPFWFCRRHAPELKKASWQLVLGTALLALAGILLLVYGPVFVERLLASVKTSPY